MRSYKFGQVSDTATWILATIVIIFVLTISVYAASKIGRTSELSAMFSGEKNQEVLAQQSFYEYLLTKNSDNTSFYNQISSSGKVNQTDELMAAAIFKKIYGQDNEILFRIADRKDDSTGLIVAANLDKSHFIELTIKSQKETF